MKLSLKRGFPFVKNQSEIKGLSLNRDEVITMSNFQGVLVPTVGKGFFNIEISTGGEVC